MEPSTIVSISGVIPKNATHIVYWSEGVPPLTLTSQSVEVSEKHVESSICIEQSRIQKLEEKIAKLEQLVQELQNSRTVTYFPKSTSPVLEGIEIVPKLDLLPTSHPVQVVMKKPTSEPVHVPVEEPVQEEEEPMQEPMQEEEEEEEEALELTEFEWKGVTYYRDSENLVYQKDGDDAPIGVWNVEKQKLLRYKV